MGGKKKPITDPKGFKSRTSVVGKRNNPLLVTIDNKLTQLQAIPSDSPLARSQKLREVRDSCDTWLRAKATKQKSGRRAGVQELRNVVDAELQLLETSTHDVGPSTSTASPRPTALERVKRLAAVHQEQQVHATSGVQYAKAADSKFRPIHTQQEQSSCGPACVKMLVQAHGKRPGDIVAEDFAQQIAASLEGDVNHDWHNQGTWGGEIASGMENVLKRVGVKNAKIHLEHPTKHISKSSESHPVLAVIDWTGGGKHYVLICGRMSGTGLRYLVQDPTYGLQVTNGVSYNPTDSSGTVLATGSFMQWCCTT